MELNKAIERFLGACESELKLSEKTSRAYSYDLGQFDDFANRSVVQPGTLTELLQSRAVRARDDQAVLR